MKYDAFLNFAVNQEKLLDTIFKNLVGFISKSKEMRKSIRLIGTRPGTINGLCQVHNQEVDHCPQFISVLLSLQKPTYDLVKFLVPTSNPSTKNEYTVKD